MSELLNAVSTEIDYDSRGSKDSSTGWQDRVPRPYFDPATVVSRGATGEIVSRYGDNSWDYRANSMDGCTALTLHWWRTPCGATNTALFGRIYEQNKAIVWILADRGDLKSFRPLQNHNLVTQKICSFAYAKGIDLFTLLIDVDEVSALCERSNVGSLYSISQLVQALWRYRKELLPDGVTMQYDQLIQKIRAVQAQRPDGTQTPLIPSQIYCSILANLLEGLGPIELELHVVLDAFRDSLEATAACKKMLTNASRQQLKLARLRLLAQSEERLRGLGWKKGPGRSLHSFIQRKICGYQIHLMHTVVAFSGMRKGEAQILPLKGVLETFHHRGRVHHVIKGYTHKLHGAKTATEWITIEQGERAIKLAALIAQTVLSIHKKKPEKGQEALLFPSTSNPFKMISNSAFSTSQKQLFETICPEVTTEDVEELNRLELERDWDRNGIEPGKRWPLRLHQFRRSLSVYAHRSGMVTLPALKAQLDHITDEMRAYYADGWSRAVNLVFDKDHFSHEWNAAKAESSYFGLAGALKIALDEQDELFGIGAQRVEQLVSSRSRKQTLELIKSGTIAYRETVLGGCLSTEECKAIPLTAINFECVESNCANLVVQRKRLDFVIRSQENVVAQLDRHSIGSVEQRLEAEHLKRMLIARDRLIHAKAQQRDPA